MAAFDSCCCCSLRLGSGFIGILSLMMSLVGGAVCCFMMMAPDMKDVIQAAYNTYDDLQNPIKIIGPNATQTGPEPLNLGDPELMYVEWTVIALLIYMFVATVVAVLLILASIMETPWMLVPWMAVQWISIFLTIGLFGVVLWYQLVAMPRFWWAVMFVVGVVILMLLAFVLVLSFYQSLREREFPEFYQDTEMVHRHIWLNQKGPYYE